MWTNLLCISHNHILVQLSCHSITKTNQGSFNVALVSGQRDALNVQIELVSARVETLESEVMTLKETV
jgi:hypothetical protein